MEASPAQHTRRRGTARTGATVATRGVSAIGIARTRRCSRVDCNEPAVATLVFSYGEQVARLVELIEEVEPQAYDLCGLHADRTSPPRGWDITDTRPAIADAPRRLEDDDTVAIIAAALQGEDAPRRVDVIDGGDAPTTPRRVTRVAAVDTPVRADAHERDPLRAALEELQRVVVPDDDDAAPAATATPMGAAGGRELPPPPEAPPPASPPVDDGGGDEAQDRPTLW